MHVVWRADEPAWDAALAALPDELRDVYFTAGYHALEDGGQASLVELDGERLLVPGMRTPIPDTALADLQTPNGYGGPLGTAGMTGARLAAAWEAWRSAAAANGVVAAFFRLHPLVDTTRWLPSDATILDDRETVLVALEDGLDAALKRAEARLRNKVQRAFAGGLAVQWNAPADWPQFEALYADAMERLGAASALRFPAAYFARLRALPSVSLATISDARGVSAACVFLHGARWTHYHLGARRADADGDHMACIFYSAIERAAHSGSRGVHLGGGATTAPDDSLLRFKKRFSDRLLRYRVARVITDRERFTELIAVWQARAGRSPAWLLGYRQSLPRGT
jgi:hypothetical protein